MRPACLFPRWHVGWIALCSCLPEMVWFIPVWHDHLQVQRTAAASTLISTRCVSCQWWQMTGPSTLCVHMPRTHLQSESLSQPQLGESSLGGWRQWWWWCVCVCVSAYLSLLETSSGDINPWFCTSVSLQMNWLFMGAREEFRAVDAHEGTEARVI